MIWACSGSPWWGPVARASRHSPRSSGAARAFLWCHHYWKPGWEKTPKEEWRRVQATLVAGDRWIVDGNYGGSFDMRFERADTVILLEPPALVCLAGALGWSLQNRGTAVQAAGCPERLDAAFLRWILGRFDALMSARSAVVGRWAQASAKVLEQVGIGGALKRLRPLTTGRSHQGSGSRDVLSGRSEVGRQDSLPGGHGSRDGI